MASKKSSRSNGNMVLNSLIGWGISTLLLLFLSRSSSSDSDGEEQKPDKNKNDNSSQIGNSVPVVLGRGMVKSPLVSYYGDFDHKPYTEEYGAHSPFDWASLIPSVLMAILAFCTQPSHVKGTVLPGASVQAGPYTGTVTGEGEINTETTTTVEEGAKNEQIIMTIISLLLQLLTALITNHLLRTTIQKGFKYYLGWQHIICWSGEEVGVKSLLMNVYNSNIEESTISGVWDNNSHVAYRSSNPNGIVAHINDENMFGGFDEGGGFVGDVRFYLGGSQQPKDSWMISQMSQSSVQAELRGLTPKYPMYITAVIPKAYIGKQATIPEMWFEIVNYPKRLHDNFSYDLQGLYNNRILKYLNDIFSYINKQDPTVIAYLEQLLTELRNTYANYSASASETNDRLKVVDNMRDILNATINDKNATSGDIDNARNNFNNALSLFNQSQAITDSIFPTIKIAVNNLIDNYPQSKRNEFSMVASPLLNLLDNGLWHLGRLGDDVNPAEAIYEILVNDQWGCNCSDTSRIDINSLLEVGLVCEEEGLGVSCLIDRSDQAKDFINKILTHINGVKYNNPTSGKLTFKLIRNDYNVESLLEFNTNNCVSLDFSRLDWSETVSSITVNFTHASNKYETGELLNSDISNRLITGSYTEKEIDGSYFTTPENALVLAQTQLLSAGYPLSAVNIECNRIAHNVTIGEPIIVNWEPYGITRQIYRITDVDYASLTDNKIKITAIEDVFGFEKTEYDYSDAPSWVDPVYPPEEVTRFRFLEMPYELTRSLDTNIYAYAAQPESHSVYWNTWRYFNYDYSRTNKTQEWSMVGKMVYGYQLGYSYDDTGFELECIGANARELFDKRMEMINNDRDIYNKYSRQNIIVVDDEIMSYDYITKLANGHYMLRGIIRGIYDTLPEQHTSESIVFFLNGGLNVNGSRRVVEEGLISNEQLEITSQTATEEQEFDVARISHMTTTRRAEQPSVMANLMFGADKGDITDFRYNFPASTQFSDRIVFKFIGRNKFYNGSILEQTDNTTYITVGEDIQNVITVLTNDEEFDIKTDARLVSEDGTISNITEIYLTWSDFCKNLPYKVGYTNNVSLIIRTYDKSRELYSYAEYRKNIIYIAPKLVGIVESEDNVQEYADSLVQSTIIVIPATDTHEQITLSYEDAPLIFVGTNMGQDNNYILGNDGDYWDITDVAYRIDGYDSETGKAIIHKISIGEDYVFSHPISVSSGSSIEAYLYRSNMWMEYRFYNN